MTPHVNRTVVAVGLQQTGKTTFLAAFWDVVRSGDVVGSLRLERTTGDMQYLNEIHSAWADCRPILRTSPAGDKPVTVLLTDATAATSTELSWTDMLGERFERQWTERAWTRGYQELVDDTVGVLLFVHPHKIREAPLIIDAQAAAKQIFDASQEPAEQTATTEEAGPVRKQKAIPYDPLKVPTQVQLVELLQFLRERRLDRRLRLSIVVSAWDLVEKVMSGVSPVRWLAESMPLLHQLVESNDDRFEPMVFGVSAQGGDYSETKSLQQAHRASERIKVVFGKSVSHDITVPVRWALGSTDF